MNEEYITKVPALQRKETCMKCGVMFFKHEEYQIICDDCEEEVKEIEDKEDQHYAEICEKEQMESLEYGIKDIMY